MYNISYYTSPVLLTFLYRRGYFDLKVIASFDKVVMGVGVVIALAFCMRGLGRERSQVYKKFFREFSLSKSKSKDDHDLKRALLEYDFEFKHWPIDWSIKQLKKPKVEPSPVMEIWKEKSLGICQIPYDVAAFLAIHSFGLKMIYPGSIGLFQNQFHPMLVQGRENLIQDHNGIRRKLETADGNEIDTMFVDNRSRSNGKTLVICSEGNAGFYEIGIASTPLTLEYSVLGWNHPGFCGSTGKPFPDQDRNAVDAVISYAINELNFPVQDILLFGWSIGGYSTVYGAARFPNVKGVILDASFDDIIPLALPRMPQSISGVVEHAVRKYVNLNNSELLKQYNGPVFIVRRTDDEVIAEDFQIQTNRGNFLLLKLLAHRFPFIFLGKQAEYVMEKISRPLEASVMRDREEDTALLRKIASYIAETNETTYPLKIGEKYSDPERTEMADFLLRKHFDDFRSSHCTPLPTNLFKMPWELPNEDFVFT